MRMAQRSTSGKLLQRMRDFGSSCAQALLCKYMSSGASPELSVRRIVTQVFSGTLKPVTVAMVEVSFASAGSAKAYVQSCTYSSDFKL